MGGAREEFLLEMYRQCSAHLDRHILIPWQSVGVIGAALAVFVVEGKGATGIQLDFLMTLAVVLCFWLAANLYDANNWFDRNLHIIANVERQFLSALDLKEIHPFFGKHRLERSDAKLLRHFAIQLTMTATVFVLVVTFHLLNRVFATDSFPDGWTWLLPYLASLAGIVGVLAVRERAGSDSRKLLRDAPGKVPSN